MGSLEQRQQLAGPGVRKPCEPRGNLRELQGGSTLGRWFRNGVAVGWASFTVVDPHHVWVSTDLACGFSDRWAFRTDSSQLINNGMTPSEAAKALVPGIRVTDIVEPGGYVGSQAGLVRVVRQGEAVAWLAAHSQVGLWLFDGYACPGSDIG